MSRKKGERNDEMRKLRAGGMRVVDIAKRFGIAPATVYRLTIDRNLIDDLAIRRPSGRNAGRPAKYPWADMDIGGSFVIPCQRKEHARIQKSIGTSALNARRWLDHKYVTKRISSGVKVTRAA